MTLETENTPNPWSKEASEQKAEAQYTPHPTERFGDKPVNNYREVDPLEERVYVNLTIKRRNGQMDGGWSQVAEGLADSSYGYPAIMLMEKESQDEKGKKVYLQKWVLTGEAIKTDAEYRENLRLEAGKQLADTALESADVTPVVSSEEKVPETNLQMHERFDREFRADLQELYARHRTAEKGSDEMHNLERQISETKQGLGDNAQKIAKLRP